MVSFQQKLTAGLTKLGVEVTYDLADQPFAALLIIGGTRHLVKIWQVRKANIPIIQRLDGMNWLHRLNGPGKTGLRHYLRAEYGNFVLSFIRRRFASQIVYQSEFSRRWWEQTKGFLRIPHSVILNGVDLDFYNPYGENVLPTDRWRILMVEGSLLGGYEFGLRIAFEFVEKLAEIASDHTNIPFPGLIELMVVGRVSEATREICNAWQCNSHQASKIVLNWAGLMPASSIPIIDRSAHLLYSSDINPACPNSVIEAMACGLPVMAFDTGALSELVDSAAGCVVPYGGDPWRLDPPDVTGLAEAALQVLSDLGHYRVGARLRAESLFGLDQMVESYLNVMLESL